MNEIIEVVLLDIEGTTTPIDFVHKTLFPYATAHIEDFVPQNLNKLKPEIESLRLEAAEDRSYSDAVFDAESVVKYLKFLIKMDRKSTPLKTIQGRIWRTGYESRELVAEVFEDVPTAFEKWQSDAKTIAIYSSGSAEAQKLLFKYSNKGDLTRYISYYFDTAIGHKGEKTSYEKIAAEINCGPGDIIFVSDVRVELDAAKSAGMRTRLSIRAGNEPVPETNDHKVIESLLDCF